MRPEARAEFERVRGELRGDGAFAVRLERWFSELRGPLVALYGADERFPPAWSALLRAIAATAAARPDELRALDHEREITPGWPPRERAVGTAAFAAPSPGPPGGVREPLPYLRELGV